MNEQQNPDETWTKAEPEKASWEKRRQKKQISTVRHSIIGRIAIELEK